jgi:hypothetical protein
MPLTESVQLRLNITTEDPIFAPSNVVPLEDWTSEVVLLEREDDPHSNTLRNCVAAVAPAFT